MPALVLGVVLPGLVLVAVVLVLVAVILVAVALVRGVQRGESGGPNGALPLLIADTMDLADLELDTDLPGLLDDQVGKGVEGIFEDKLFNRAKINERLRGWLWGLKLGHGGPALKHRRPRG